MPKTDRNSTDYSIELLRSLTLKGMVRGIEKEALRVGETGFIAQTDHPAALGSALTHPSITTDYSEALLEYISPVLVSEEQSIEFLEQLHSFTLRNSTADVIWPASMPCVLEGDASIPIARYGSSNVGQMKHVYRQGLGVRYGRIMQSIAGIHYNFSFPEQFWIDYQQQLGETGDLMDFKSKYYFTLIRNFRCHSWLLLYLFGASPVLDRSFMNERKFDLEQFLPNTFGLEYATSLRMSDLGYQNAAQDDLQVSYNSLDEYTKTLGEAVRRPYPPYEEIGMKKEGQYVQLNTNILQIENEFYSDIRPKRVTRSGEKPIHALQQRGVEYIEVRVLDINPFLPVGIDAQQIRFLDAFLLHSLMLGCDPQTASDCQQIKENQRKVVMRGRDPALTLGGNGGQTPFADQAHHLLDSIASVAAILDEANGTDQYTIAVSAQRGKVDKPETTPSGQVMAEIKSGKEYIDISLAQARAHKEYFLAQEINPDKDAQLHSIAERSLADQREMERSDEVSFEQYLEAYNGT